jgi:hypothetical protein
MDYDEFTRKANDLIEQTEKEIAETKEILYSSPGSQAEYDAKRRLSSYNQRVALEEKPPLYDQTLLDPISQLWGAPPEVLGKTMAGDDEERKTINEDMDFANIYALWGGPLSPKPLTEEDVDVISPSIDGIRQLWTDEALDPGADDSTFDSDSKSDFSAYAGLEWWDRVSEDGKEIRLSMMLADEVYEEELQEEVEKVPMTYEQFAMETENMIQQVEDERKETEAILAAPPGADAPAELDGIEEVSSSSLETALDADAVAASEEFEEMIMALSQEDGAINEEASNDDDFAVLEMDVEDDFPLQSNITDQAESNVKMGEEKADAIIEQ